MSEKQRPTSSTWCPFGPFLQLPARILMLFPAFLIFLFFSSSIPLLFPSALVVEASSSSPPSSPSASGGGVKRQNTAEMFHRVKDGELSGDSSGDDDGGGLNAPLGAVSDGSSQSPSITGGTIKRRQLVGSTYIRGTGKGVKTLRRKKQKKRAKRYRKIPATNKGAVNGDGPITFVKGKGGNPAANKGKKPSGQRWPPAKSHVKHSKRHKSAEAIGPGGDQNDEELNLSYSDVASNLRAQEERRNATPEELSSLDGPGFGFDHHETHDPEYNHQNHHHREENGGASPSMAAEHVPKAVEEASRKLMKC